MTHVYRGEGDVAESYALTARAEAQRRGVCERQSISYCELVDVALADVRQAQGRFAESGEILASRVDTAIRPNAMRAFAAWPFFLLGDYDRVRTLVNQLDRVSQWARQTEMTPKYLFMVLYMGHVVLGFDTRAQMEKLAAEQLLAWEDEASRNAANPYGVRLLAILDDLKQWLQAG